MTTPRIEEMVAKILDDLPRYAMTREDKMWGLKKLSNGAYADISDFDEILIEALTEAHQAGIDEAVEVVKEIKANRKIPYQALRLSGGCPDCGAEVNQSFVDNEFKEAIDQALDDTIKALQDNK